LPDGLELSADLEASALGGTLAAGHAEPRIAEVLKRACVRKRPSAGVAWATKGFDPFSGRFLHEVAGELAPEGTPLAVITDPRSRQEVARGLPTA
jgi:glycerol-3-phosphate dehydrogenase (NAD(P)+)